MRAKEGFLLEQSLCSQVPDVLVHASFVALVGKAGEVVSVYSPESADVGHRPDLRLAEGVGPAAVLM